MHNINTKLNLNLLEENAGEADYFGEPAAHLFAFLKHHRTRCVYLPQSPCKSCGYCKDRADKQTW